MEFEVQLAGEVGRRPRLARAHIMWLANRTFSMPTDKQTNMHREGIFILTSLFGLHGMLILTSLCGLHTIHKTIDSLALRAI